MSKECINSCYDEACAHNNAIPVVDMVDSLRMISDDTNQSVDRNIYKQVQTPQVFSGELIIEAYSQEFNNIFTDDASVFESFGGEINLVKGNRENIKITTKTDLLIYSVFSL